MLADDQTSLLQLRQGFADRGAADFKALTQLGFGWQQAVAIGEFAGSNAGQDFIGGLLREGRTLANHGGETILEVSRLTTADFILKLI